MIRAYPQGGIAKIMGTMGLISTEHNIAKQCPKGRNEEKKQVELEQSDAGYVREDAHLICKFTMLMVAF